MIEVVLISTYELGRQPFGLASPAAWLKEVGTSVTCQDLAVQGHGSDESDGSQTGVVDAGGGYDPYNQGEPRAKGIPDKGSKRKR